MAATAQAVPTPDLSRLLPEGALWIGGRSITEASGGRVSHVNPASGQLLKDFPIAGAAEVDQAVSAARKAFDGWKRVPAPRRRDLLLAIAERLASEGEALATIGALDAGTPVVVGAALSSAVPADWFRYYAGWADKLEGTVPASYDENAFYYTRRVPFGVVAIITAFNAPMAFVAMKVAPALAAGNTVVLKPSELAPWALMRFAEICREVGLPDGVVNVIPGNSQAGQALIAHPGIDRISFTGGEKTAKQIMAGAAPRLTPVSFELGGKSASIIFEDADLQGAAGLAIQGSIALLSGQACIAGTRILVQRPVYERVIDLLASIAGALPIGDPRSPDTVVGPIINQFHFERIHKVIAGEDGRSRLVCGGQRMGGALGAGYYIPPTIFADVDQDSSLAQEEVFGPVLAVIPFDTEEQAVAIANNSRYGLAGYVFTESAGRAHRVAQAINAGLVSVNSPYTVPANVPFGGFKASGFGREGGHDGVLEMTHCQSIQIGIGRATGAAS
jgi:aldehyde dehydrogenase (NAD+)